MATTTPFGPTTPGLRQLFIIPTTSVQPLKPPTPAHGPNVPEAPTAPGDAANAATTSPSHADVPSLSLPSGTGPLGAALTGAQAASPTGNIYGAITGQQPTEIGALPTLGMGLASSMVPGYGMSIGLPSALLGAGGALMTLYGMPGQQTNGHLNGPITEGPQAESARLAAPFGRVTDTGAYRSGIDTEAAFPQPESAPAIPGTGNSVGGNLASSDASAPGAGSVADGPGSGNGAGGGGGGASGTSGAPSSAEGDARGGTVGRRNPSRPGPTDTMTIRATPGEEVIRKSEASKPLVRKALKDINRPGQGRVERGLSSLFKGSR